MAKKFTELRAGMSQAAREKSDGMARQMLAEMPLNELRQARGLTQKMLAEVLHVQQPSIAKIEKRTDMYLSTLRSHIEAMGGELDVIARFPDGSVKINNFTDLGVAARSDDWGSTPRVALFQERGVTSSQDEHQVTD
jgi:DNA-binding XRE family transcriptional regulator